MVRNYLVWKVTVHNIIDRYASLHQFICRRNKHATTLVSSILSYSGSFDLHLPLIFGLNFALEKWSAQSAGRRVFISQALSQGDRPKMEQFCKSDELHPNGSGRNVL